ncbi:MAG: hypothetical protein QOJ81_577, partial [Chloroflexota bacterium]|nr:hypothetical protein [Chloroflexota bacterium]
GVYYASPESHIRKYSPEGIFIWDRELPVADGWATILRMAADESGLYLGGTVGGHWPGQDPSPSLEEYDAYAARFTSDGDLVWATQFHITRGEGDFFDDGVALAPTAVYVGGTFISGEGFLARLDRDGTFRWRVDVPFPSEFSGIAADADGAVMVGTGSDLHAYAPNGSLRWTRDSGPTASYWEVLAAPGGGTLVLEQFTGGGSHDIRIRRYSPAGSLGAAHVLFSAPRGDPTPVGLASFGNRVFAAWFSEEGERYRVGWASLDFGLGIAWSRNHLLSAGQSYPSALAVSPRGGYVLSPSLLAKFAIDTVAPLTTWVEYALPADFQIPDEMVSGRAFWNGHDDLSGIDHYQLQQSQNGGSWKNLKLADPAAAKQVTDEKPGASYRFRVRAIDRSGNVGKWRTSPGYALSLVQEASQSIVYDSNWDFTPDADASGGGTMMATKAGSTATFTFTGDAFGFVTIIGPDIGSVDVFIDGKSVGTLDLHSATDTARYVAFARSWAKVGSHQVKLVVDGTVGHAQIQIDAFEVRATQ